LDEMDGTLSSQNPVDKAASRSLITLKGLTYAPTGGAVAAPTTSLPKQSAGSQLDYRYCWLRDATFTLFALVRVGYQDEARCWREWRSARLPEVPRKCKSFTVRASAGSMNTSALAGDMKIPPGPRG
jgi:hypothetical protein